MEKCSQPREEAIGCIFRDAIPEGMSIFGLGTLCGERLKKIFPLSRSHNF